jgi:hypothetical protein
MYQLNNKDSYKGIVWSLGDVFEMVGFVFVIFAFVVSAWVIF